MRYGVIQNSDFQTVLVRGSFDASENVEAPQPITSNLQSNLVISDVNKTNLSIYGSTALLLDPGLFFSFLILYAVGRTPWTSDQPVARPLPTHRTTKTQNKRIYKRACIEWGSNPRSQWGKTVHALDRAATGIGN
jgi:hypothetical protein